MSKKIAEERALEFYPPFYVHYPGSDTETYDANIKNRKRYIEGYEQAEKDLALTWKDMKRIINIDEEIMGDPDVYPEWKEEQPYYEEVLWRFNKAKEEKK